MQDELVKEVTEELLKFQIEISAQNDTYGQLHKALSRIIGDLITSDFPRLVFVLYRLDISENKLKSLLHQSIEKAAGDTIAAMIIERQLEKIKSRKAFNYKNEDIPDDEKW